MVAGRHYSRRYVLQLIRRRGIFALVPFVIAVGLAVTIARSWPDLFYAQSTIAVIRQQVPESYVRSTVTGAFADRVRAVSEALRTPSRMEALIKEFDLYPEARRTAPLSAVVAWMAQSIRVEVVRPDTIVVGFGGYERTKVAPVAERLTEWFVADSLASREELAGTTSQFLDGQLEAARQKLREQEQRVQKYREEHAGELPTEVGTNLQILQNAYTRLRTLEESVRQDRERRERLQDELSRLPVVTEATPADAPDDAAVTADTAADAAAATDDPTDVAGDKKADATPAAPIDPATAITQANAQIAAARTIDQRLRIARAALAALQQRYTPEHPDVIALQAQVHRLEEAAANTPMPTPQGRGAGPDALRRIVIEAEIKQIDARIASREMPQQQLTDAVGTYQSRVEGAPKREAEWAELTRDYATLEQIYTNLLTKNQDSRLSANLERERFGERLRVTTPPTEPTAPVSPNRPRVVLIGLAIGLFLAVAALTAFEVFDTGLRGENEVLMTLRLPVLAMLPVAKTSTERRRARYRFALGSALLLLIIIAGVVWRSV